MEHRIFPFKINKTFSTFEELKQNIETNLQTSNESYNSMKVASDRDYSTGTSDIEKQDLAEIETTFQHKLHHVCKYSFLSNNILFLKFHSELEDQNLGLIARYSRYDEHHTRVKSPPRFKKPFIVYIKDKTHGIMFAPSGTPARVDYICFNDLQSLLLTVFQEEKKFTSNEIDQLFLLVNSDSKVDKILSVTANVTDQGTRQRHGYFMSNFRDITDYLSRRKQYGEFITDILSIRVKYGEDKLAILTFNGYERTPSILTNLSERDIESKRDFYEWLGTLLLNFIQS
jgi:hypothetical protein